jgi:hypothetical protein
MFAVLTAFTEGVTLFYVDGVGEEGDDENGKIYPRLT